MPKLLTRIVALVLVPCLLADPVTAVALSTPHFNRTDVGASSLYNSALIEQALSQPLKSSSYLDRFLAGSRQIKRTLGSLVRSKKSLETTNPFKRISQTESTRWLIHEILVSHLRAIGQDAEPPDPEDSSPELYWEEVFNRAGHPELLRSAMPDILEIEIVGFRPYRLRQPWSPEEYVHLALEALGEMHEATALKNTPAGRKPGPIRRPGGERDLNAVMSHARGHGWEGVHWDTRAAGREQPALGPRIDRLRYTPSNQPPKDRLMQTRKRQSSLETKSERAMARAIKNIEESEHLLRTLLEKVGVDAEDVQRIMMTLTHLEEASMHLAGDLIKHPIALAEKNMLFLLRKAFGKIRLLENARENPDYPQWRELSDALGRWQRAIKDTRAVRSQRSRGFNIKTSKSKGLTQKPYGSYATPQLIEGQFRDAEHGLEELSLQDRGRLAHQLRLGDQAFTPEFKAAFPYFWDEVRFVQRLIRGEDVQDVLREVWTYYLSHRYPSSVARIEIYPIGEWDDFTTGLMGRSYAIESDDGTLRIFIDLKSPDNAISVFHEIYEHLIVPLDPSITMAQREANVPHALAALAETAFADGLYSRRAKDQLSHMRAGKPGVRSSRPGYTDHEQMTIREFAAQYTRVQGEIINTKFSLAGASDLPLMTARQDYALAHAKELNTQALDLIKLAKKRTQFDLPLTEADFALVDAQFTQAAEWEALRAADKHTDLIRETVLLQFTMALFDAFRETDISADELHAAYQTIPRREPAARIINAIREGFIAEYPDLAMDFSIALDTSLDRVVEMLKKDESSRPPRNKRHGDIHSITDFMFDWELVGLPFLGASVGIFLTGILMKSPVPGAILGILTGVYWSTSPRSIRSAA